MDELGELLADVECLYWSTDNAHDRLDLLKELREKVDEMKGVSRSPRRMQAGA